MADEPADEPLGQRIGRNLEEGREGGLPCLGLAEIIVGDAGGDDAERAVALVEFQNVESGLVGETDHLGLAVEEQAEAAASVDGKEDPILGRPLLQLILGPGVPGLDGRTAVGEPRDQAHEDGQAETLRQIEGLPGHFVGFLLVGGLVAEDLGELHIVAAVLFVLRAVHAGIVGADDEEAAVGPGDRGVHERVGRDVEADVLERDEGPFPGEGHAEGFLVGHLLVHRPGRLERLVLAGQMDEVFHDLGGGRSGVRVSGREARVDGP